VAEWQGSQGRPEPGLVALTVNVPSREVEALERQASYDGISRTDVVLRSLTLGRILWEATRSGERVLIQGTDGNMREIDVRETPDNPDSWRRSRGSRA
jgi:hypothetical protein